jgi:hypothetical protein
MSDETHPFEVTDGGNYRLITPTGDLRPDEMTITIGETTYVFDQLVAVDDSSKLRPEILVYERMNVLDGVGQTFGGAEPTEYGVTD